VSPRLLYITPSIPHGIDRFERSDL